MHTRGPTWSPRTRAPAGLWTVPAYAVEPNTPTQPDPVLEGRYVGKCPGAQSVLK